MSTINCCMSLKDEVDVGCVQHVPARKCVCLHSTTAHVYTYAQCVARIVFVPRQTARLLLHALSAVCAVQSRMNGGIVERRRRKLPSVLFTRSARIFTLENFFGDYAERDKVFGMSLLSHRWLVVPQTTFIASKLTPSCSKG